MASLEATSRLPIGVFDSGVGGLTVLSALRAAMPQECFLYLGDTARLPYGAKSAETVRRYALQASRALVDRGVKYLVVACNTATSAALEALRAAYSPVPVIGVVEPGAVASATASARGRIAVIATEGTVRGGAYEQAILRIRPKARVVSKACPLFVALAEEGWTRGDLVAGIISRYLSPLMETVPDERPDCLVLGCTHFPVLADEMRRVLGPAVKLVDSAVTTAAVVARELATLGFLRPCAEGDPHLRFLATDGRDRFARVGSIFLQERIDPEQVELVDL